MTKRKSKRVLAVADFHCGHHAGLTPPRWQRKVGGDGHWERIANLQRETWALFSGWIKELRPIDVLLHGGDCIEGKGERSGGTELITSDREEQAEMAAEIIRYINADKVIMVYGTPYHTGRLEDWEDVVARHEDVKAEKIGSHEWIDVNGLIFDLKHFIGASSIPHGRHTAIARARLWNLLWAEREAQPKADVVLRAHVHYFDYCGDRRGVNIILPALQAAATKFGARGCEGEVDFGLVYFDVTSREDWHWEERIETPASSIPAPVSV